MILSKIGVHEREEQIVSCHELVKGKCNAEV